MNYFNKGSVGLVLIFWAMLLGLHAVGNSDLFWQLKTGQIILENHQVPQTDSFSFTVAGKEWINLEWLACVLFWKVFQGIPPSFKTERHAC